MVVNNGSQTCTWTLPNGPIHAGDTVIGFTHTTDSLDATDMAPQKITDNLGNIYSMGSAIQWNGFAEPINIFYLTQIVGNPTTLTFDFTQYADASPTILGTCNMGLTEYSVAVQSVAFTGPTSVGSTTTPSITFTPSAAGALWFMAAAQTTAGVDALLTNDFVVGADTWFTPSTGFGTATWNKVNLAPPSAQTLSVTASEGNTNASILIGAAAQISNSSASIAHVQSVAEHPATSTTTCTTAAFTAIGAGDWVILDVGEGGASNVLGITDNASGRFNSWVPIGTTVALNGSTNYVRYYVGMNIQGSPTTLTLTGNASMSYCNFAFEEFSGVQQVDTTSGSFTAIATQNPGQTITTNYNDSTIVTLLLSNDTSQPTQPTGYTLGENDFATSGFMNAYQMAVGSPGSYSPIWSTSAAPPAADYIATISLKGNGHVGCGSNVTVGTQCVMELTTSGTFSPPPGWPGYADKIEAVGSGGSGFAATTSASGGGGGGGEYAAESGGTSLTLTGSSTYTVGTANGSTDTSITAGSTTITAHHGTAPSAVGANHGTGGTGSTNTVHFNGGNGGTGSATTHTPGSGGGGAGGPLGAGAVGANSASTAGWKGSGGGGDGNSASATAGTAGTSATAGGAAGSPNGAAGGNGASSGTATAGSASTSSLNWANSTYGVSGGGGGGGGNSASSGTANGGAGGNGGPTGSTGFGGGGGGGGSARSSGGAAGAGMPGAIIITYTPS